MAAGLIDNLAIARLFRQFEQFLSAPVHRSTEYIGEP
jgi:hypothetical protein